MKAPQDEVVGDSGTGAFQPPQEASVRRISFPALSLALLSAFGVFAAFAAAQPDSADPLQRLALASVLCAIPAAALTLLWPTFPRALALLVSSCFSVFLVVAFISFLMNGELVWWPLVDAAVVVAAALCAARAGQLARQRHTRRSSRRASARS